MPMHWNDQFAARARVDVLAPAVTDAVSGQPASKNIAARIERFVAATYGFGVLREKPTSIDAEYWAIAKCKGGWRVELAFASKDRGMGGLRLLRPGSGAEASVETIAYHDRSFGSNWKSAKSGDFRTIQRRYSHAFALCCLFILFML